MFLAHPFPAGLGPFAGRMQSESIRRAGGQLLFEPRMRVVHDFEGWPMEVDIRRNCGYGTVIARLHDRALPFACLTHLGVFSIPIFVVGKQLKVGAIAFDVQKVTVSDGLRSRLYWRALSWCTPLKHLECGSRSKAKRPWILNIDEAWSAIVERGRRY